VVNSSFQLLALQRRLQPCAIRWFAESSGDAVHLIHRPPFARHAELGLLGAQAYTYIRTAVSEASATIPSGREPTFYLSDHAGNLEMAFDLENVRQIAERVAASQGLELVDVELRGGGKARMLRLFIDKPGGVTHEDCAWVSRELGTILDVEDAILGGSYTLEVSSPGLDRKLMKAADYDRFAGCRIRLTTREPVEGNRHFEGRLQGLRDGRVSLEVGSKKVPSHTVELDLGNVEKANLVPEF
jgi:ribosome maturation factor RimP